MAILDKKERLWIEYSHSKSTAVREELIMEYVSLVKLVAGRLAIYLGANVEYDDHDQQYDQRAYKTPFIFHIEQPCNKCRQQNNKRSCIFIFVFRLQLYRLQPI